MLVLSVRNRLCSLIVCIHEVARLNDGLRQHLLLIVPLVSHIDDAPCLFNDGLLGGCFASVGVFAKLSGLQD